MYYLYFGGKHNLFSLVVMRIDDVLYYKNTSYGMVDSIGRDGTDMPLILNKWNSSDLSNGTVISHNS